MPLSFAKLHPPVRIWLVLVHIVSKLALQPLSLRSQGWIKVKTLAWREANRDRWEMFERA
jgi:hypothetical protein